MKFLHSIALLLCIGLHTGQSALAQEAEKEAQKLDLTKLRTQALLNKGGITKSVLDKFRLKQRTKNGTSVTFSNADEWQVLYESLVNADLRPTDKKLKPFATFFEKDVTKQNLNNAIPVGIINFDAAFLTQEQLKKNQELKAKNQSADDITTENVFVFAASVLQQDVFQGDISFRISTTYHFTNIDNPISSFEIDFQDGKGFRKYDFKDQTVSYQYSSTGEHPITFRFITRRGVYVSHSAINVKLLKRAPVFRSFEVVEKAEKTDSVQDSTTRTARVAAVAGGNARILLGCDNVFDRPVIIAEGFDPLNDRTLDNLEADYYARLYSLRNAGYDLVLLDYHNGRDWIQNNANVMTALIEEVNLTKLVRTG